MSSLSSKDLLKLIHVAISQENPEAAIKYHRLLTKQVTPESDKQIHDLANLIQNLVLLKAITNSNQH